MQKKIGLISILAAILLFAGAPVSWSQYIPNAPFKPKVLAAPDFSIKDIKGKTFSLSAHRGKPVMIFFGTTWCPGCRAEVPVYKKVHETYSPRGLVVIYIDIMEPAKKVTRFAETNSITYPVLLDEDGAVSRAYNVVGVPMIILLDKDGIVTKIGHSSSEMPLEKVLTDQ
ncbi:MAG TPA: TlpA disulfide reductase family protein [Smithellaceae bacterium]|jgi:peroxiredoxin|nr:TlpA disulfide reductase family protein [Smithellaceae bacterium]